jgi:hypothetical protein
MIPGFAADGFVVSRSEAQMQSDAFALSLFGQ